MIRNDWIDNAVDSDPARRATWLLRILSTVWLLWQHCRHHRPIVLELILIIADVAQCCTMLHIFFHLRHTPTTLVKPNAGSVHEDSHRFARPKMLWMPWFEAAATTSEIRIGTAKGLESCSFRKNRISQVLPSFTRCSGVKSWDAWRPRPI